MNSSGVLSKPARAAMLIAVLLGIVLAGFQATRADALQAAQTRPNELLVYDWNKPATKMHHGFPKEKPPRPSANGDWTKPINFAEGTLYFRVQIRRQPIPQNMNLQFCAWQFNLTRENCIYTQPVVGTPGNVVTWSVPVQKMWKKGGVPIDWSQPRQHYGSPIKNSRGKPVSNFHDWNWNGENPDKWYPLDYRFTVVVVAKGATFSGWQNYINN